MGEITYFQGILPPNGAAAAGRSASRSGRVPGPAQWTSSDDLILNALAPLRDELDTALARGDEETALRLAYGALGQIADTLAAARGDLLQAWQVRIHALLVELESLPLKPQTDGTLMEQGTAVRVSYRNWAIDRSQVDDWAQALSKRFQALWPGAWLVLPNAMSAKTGPSRKPAIGAGVR